MMNETLLIAFASWEDRFRIGFDRNLKNGRVNSALIFYFDAYAERSSKNTDVIKKICMKEDILLQLVELNIDEPAKNWRRVLDSIESKMEHCQKILIDISTMPRDIIWYILWLIEQKSISASYVYYSPIKYGQWLSRDPQSPRFVYKLSGIALPSAKTALLITTGFDLQRVKRLINWFEPKKLIIGIQSATQFERNKAAMAEYRKMLEKESDCSIFELDAFDENRGMIAIEQQLQNIEPHYNIIMSSLGPKLTAITLYKIKKQRTNIGLVYTPSRQYNRNYSHGIGHRYHGAV